MVPWVFIGARSQGIAVLKAIVLAGFCPQCIVMPTETTTEELTEVKALTQTHLLLSDDLNDIVDSLSQSYFALVSRYHIIPKNVFTIPKWGMYNLHPSLLPAYPGVHPISWALIRQESVTGVTLHEMSETIDGGNIVAQQKVIITPQHDIHRLTTDCNLAVGRLTTRFLQQINQSRARPKTSKQNGRGFYARRRKHDDSYIDWQQTAESLDCFSRALPDPYPLPFCYTGHGEKILFQSLRAVEKSCAKKSGMVLEILDKNQYLIACGQNCVRATTETALHCGQQLF